MNNCHLEKEESNMKFESLGISPAILKALNDEGYESPSPIQEQAIPAVLKRRDVLGLAQTGTGKTAAFAVPTLQLLDESKSIHHGKRSIRSLVITPTRELALQIYESFNRYGNHLDIRATVIFGGVTQHTQVRALQNGVDVLVATPGRLDDLIKQRYVDLKHVEIFILDEADRMLDMGFIHDIERIIKRLPAKKQTLLFSATMPKEIDVIAKRLLHQPVTVSVAPVSSAVDTVDQSVYYIDRVNKSTLLRKILNENKDEQVLVFTRTKRGADRVAKDLNRNHIKAESIHGDKSQNARVRALDNFKSKESRVMVATDIAARGIDIDSLGMVINFEIPDVPETYVHRIGRTGRAGSSGVAISFCDFIEAPLLKDIEKTIAKKIKVIENHEFPLQDKTPKKEKEKQKQQNRSKRSAQKTETKPAKKNYSHHKPKTIDVGLDGKEKKQRRKKIFYK